MENLTPVLLFLSLISIMFNVIVIAWIERARRRENKELAILFTRLASNLNKFMRRENEIPSPDAAYPEPKLWNPSTDPEAQH